MTTQLFAPDDRPLIDAGTLDLIRKGKALDLLDIEIEKKKEELRLAKAVATLNTIEADQKQRSDEASMASDIYHQRYYFTGAVDAKTVRECINHCTYWANSKPGCDITIILNSQGGDLFFGMMLFDFLRELDTRGHKVRIGTYGLAASMAGIILQAASKGERYVGGESWTLIHEVSSQAAGNATQIRSASKFADDVCARVRNIFLNNQTMALEAHTASEKMTLEAFDAKWKNNDWWLASEEMIRLGFADKIGSPVFNEPDEPAA